MIDFTLSWLKGMETIRGSPPETNQTRFHPKVFQPFFTTKQGRQGLSLSRAKRYVELHGGVLNMVKSNGKGSLFEIRLPLKPDAILREPHLADLQDDSAKTTLPKTGEAS